jgi:hypothetical protein
MVGFVYIMSSPLFSRIKIGKSTKDPSKDRLSELNQETGNPEKFKCEYYALVGNENTLERAIHKRFASRRPNPKREFFDVSILEAIESIRDLSQDHGGLKHEEISFREVKKINYDDGSIYEGETLNDKHNGQGILKHKIYLDLSDRKFLSKSFFVGDNWKEIPKNFTINDKKKFREIEYKYIGEWKNGHQDGQGTLFLDGHIKNEGEWKDGKLNGFGTDLTKDGTGYIGQFKHGKYHGKGTYTSMNSFEGKRVNLSASKSKYVGQFKNDNKHGQGEYTYENDNIKEYYQGAWLNDEKHGKGYEKITNSNGQILEYTGEYLKDEKHGEGYEKITKIDGEIIKYTGEFKGGNRQNGTEVTYHTNGKVTKLSAENWDIRYPTGFAKEIIKYPDGSISEYKGSWHGFYGGENQHGGRVEQGTEIYTFNDGTIRKRSGQWVNGKLSGTGTETISKEDTIISEYSGEWLDGKKLSEDFEAIKIQSHDKINDLTVSPTPSKSNQSFRWLWICAGGILILFWLDII